MRIIRVIATFIPIFILLPGAIDAAETINKVVAVVNDEVISKQDVDHLLAVLYAQYSQEYKGDELLKKMEEAKRDILGQMIEDKLILSRAKELGIKVTDLEIKDKLENVIKGFPTEGEFYKTLETQGVTVADLKDRYRDQIMMKKLIDMEIKSRIAVLPSEISDYYEKNKDAFKKDEEYRVKNILIKASDDVSFELAKVEIDNIYNKLKEGADFDAIARTSSHGPNAEQAGELGYIKRGQMLEGLDEVIFKLNKGEFSETVKSNIGYHIFKVEDIRHAGYLSLEDVRGDIQTQLFKKKFKAKIDEWLSELKKKAYICIK